MGNALTPRRSATIADMLTQDEVYLSGRELATAAGMSPARLARLVQVGLVEPVAPGMDAFTVATASRLRRMVRLHAELGVNFTAAAIIADLVQRLERLDAELIRLRRHG